MPPFTAPLQTHLSDTARSVRLTLPKPQKSRTALRFKARQGRAAAALANMAKFPAGRCRPRPGDLGRYRADPGRPRSRPAGGLGAKWGGQQPRPPGDQQNPAAGLPRPRRNPRTAATAPSGRPAPAGPRSHRPRSARLPPQARRLPPTAAAALPTCGAGWAGAGQGGLRRAQGSAEPQVPGAAQMPRR